MHTHTDIHTDMGSVRKRERNIHKTQKGKRKQTKGGGLLHEVTLNVNLYVSFIAHTEAFPLMFVM